MGAWHCIVSVFSSKNDFWLTLLISSSLSCTSKVNNGQCQNKMQMKILMKYFFLIQNDHTISDYKLQIRIPPMKMCTRCNFIWQILSVTCCRSANFSGNSGFLHQYNWQSLYKFEILLTFSEVLGHIWSRIWPVCGSNLQSLSFSLTYHQILSCYDG
jgi:hypothetical protein